LKYKYQWTNVEKAFLEAGQNSEITLKNISLNFNIPYQTVRRKAAADKWYTKRLIAWYATKPAKT
jgi:hypothetical protein